MLRQGVDGGVSIAPNPVQNPLLTTIESHAGLL
jgi:hypothetical protein